MRGRVALALLAIAAAVIALAPSCRDRGPPVPMRADDPPLATVTASAQSVPQEILLDGTLEAVFQSTVAAQTSGRVEQLPYDVGDYVEKGAVIVRFAGREQAAQLGSAEANVREAQAQLADAQTEQKRVQNLFERGLVARASLDKADAAFKSAQARYDAAQASATVSREGAGYTVVRAPYAGIVVKRHIQVGETATVGRPLMTGLSLEHLRVAVEVPQQAIEALRAQPRVRVLMPDGSSVDVDKLHLSPQADTATHTFHAQLDLPQGQHGGYPGVLVKIAVASGEHQALLLPATSIVRRSEVTAVYVVGEANRVSLRYVRIGTAAADGRVPVLSGLEAGERVALDPIAAGVELKRQVSA